MSRVFGGLVLASCVVFAACSLGPDKPKPKALETVKPAIAGRVVWRVRTSDVAFPLSVAVNGNTFTVAASDGTLTALDASTGRQLWQGSAGAKLSAGVGSDGRVAAVVTRDGQVVVLDSGKVLWKRPIATRVVTAPLVAGERVFVVGVDRSVTAFDAQNGAQLWSVQRPGEALTLAQSGVAAAFKNTLLVGQGPRLAGLDPSNGAVRWEVPLAAPRGSNEVERLADLVGPMARVGDVVCVRAFQAAVGCVNAESGSLVWARNVGGREGVAADAQHLYAADASDRITAWNATTGVVVWTSDAYLNRQLSTPFSLGPAIVFGDFEGQLHFLSADRGVAQLRLETDGSPIAAPPVVSGTTVLVVTRNGGLFGLRPE
ncbi:MAG: outer membrane protein assembly factor BamB [Pseudomonadota bacterium]|nr:outer membrane protein assembly factor BamB [Pseudomonadota bacterium]